MKYLRISPIQISIVALLLKTTIAYTYQYERTRCLSSIPYPVHGSLSFSGHFLLNLVCDEPDKDIAANAPGDPPGALYCDPNEKNTQLKSLELPECIPLQKPLPEYIQMVLTYSYEVVDGNCKTLDRHSLDVFKYDVFRLIKPFCQECHVIQKDKADCVKTGPEGVVRQEKLGLLRKYDPRKPLPFYIELWENITEQVQITMDIFSVGSEKLKHVDFGAWVAMCDDVLNSIPTILNIHHKVSCRGCSTSHYKDETTGGRCLQCPFGYWTQGYHGQDTGYNSVTDCTACPYSPIGDREKFLRLCYKRN